MSTFFFPNSGNPDQTAYFVASDLVLHCLKMYNKTDARLKWAKETLQVKLE